MGGPLASDTLALNGSAVALTPCPELFCVPNAETAHSDYLNVQPDTSGRDMDLFIARQPIFTPQHKVFGYDLLFRSGPENVFPDVDPTYASARLLADSLLQLGLGDLTANTHAFIHFTLSLLLGPYATMLPPQNLIIEIPETVIVDRPVVQACMDLHAAGYRIALDNFRNAATHAGLLGHAALLKVNTLTVSASEQKAIIQRARALKPRVPQIIATKVETYAAHAAAVACGFDLFQGHYFAAPAMLHTTRLPEARLTYLTLLKEVSAKELNTRRVADVIAKDVTLTYKLLRYANSSFFALRRRITSVHECLLLLGDREIKRWASLLNLASVGSSKPTELVIDCAVRAHLCAALAEKAGLQAAADHCFLIGLFSLLEALLDQSFESIFAVLHVAPEVANTLQGVPGPLRDLYLTVVAYLQGNWPYVAGWTKNHNVSEALLPQLHRQALLWARDTLTPVAAGASGQA